MARRTDNALGEAIRLKRCFGGNRYVKDKSTKFTSSRTGIVFVEFDEDAYKERRRLGGTRRF